MLVHFGIDNLVAEWTSSTVCIGTFDGVHLGHRSLLTHAVLHAREHEEPSIVLTFDRHPAAVLKPDSCPPAIGTLEQNVIRLRESGMSGCVIMPFDVELSQWSAERFFEEVIVRALKGRRVVVGHDFAFGHQRRGTHAFLQDRIETHVVEPFLVDGKRVSSSHVRALVSDGRVDEVGGFLGRCFSLVGVVVQGQKLGRTLGYPTLNLARSMETVVPADGVYACRCVTPLGEYGAAVSIGMRPAVDGKHRTIEAYLLDYPGESLYGARVELTFVRRLRGEWDFPSLDALVEQIGRDVEATRETLSV